MDSYVLYGPGGASPLQLGSWVRADEGPDFDPGALLVPQYVDTPFNEGALALEMSGVRRFRFPLVFGSNGAWGGLLGAESLLRRAARPGGYVDLQLEGVPSTEAVRFDLLHGRWQPEYDLRHQRAPVRLGTLELGVKPYGYWPTWILLASVGSVALLGGVASLPAASIIGDAPGWVKLAIRPSVASQYPMGSWPVDMLAWSFRPHPSFVSRWPAASLASSVIGSQITSSYMPEGKVLTVYPSGPLGWQPIAHATVPSAFAPAYAGRFRVFAHAKLSPSSPPWKLAIDTTTHPGMALASANQVATLMAEAFDIASYLPQASPALTLLDLGEITLPVSGSGLWQTSLLRLWAGPPSPATVAPSTGISIGGLHLMPVDTPNAVLARGLVQPSSFMGPAPLTSFVPTIGRLHVDSKDREALVVEAAANLGSAYPIANVLGHHYGDFPMIGPSDIGVHLLGGMRRIGRYEMGSYPQIMAKFDPWAYYRFEESAGPTVADARGSWHGSYTSIQLQAPGAAGFAPSYDNTGYALVPSVGAGLMATVWTMVVWYTHTATVTVGSYDTVYGRGDSGLSLRNHYGAQFNRSGALIWRTGGNTGDITVGPASNINIAPSPVMLVHVHHPGSVYANYFIGIPGQGPTFQASKQIQDGIGSVYGSGPLGIGAWGNGAQPYTNGIIDELSIHMGTAWASDAVASAFYALASPPAAVAPSHNPVAFTAPAHAAVSVHYQPRFQFAKGI